MADDKICTSLIFDSVCASNGISMDWGRGNDLMIFPTSRPTHITDSKKKHTLGEIKLYQTKWHVNLYGDIIRKLLNESHGIFLSLQKIEDDPSTVRSQLVKVSHTYRSIIRVCVENLQSAADECDNPEAKEELELYSQLFYKIELIWNLCEILFIDIQPGGVIMNQLLDWIQWHFPEYQKQAKEILEYPHQHQHQHYWNAIFSYVLQGKLEGARKMLKLHPEQHSDCFLSIDELLRKMPVFSSYSGHSLAEFNLRWRHWQDECHQRLIDREFVSNENIVIIAKILSGDKSVYASLVHVCETWYHLLVSRLLYSNPTFKGHELQHLAEECIYICGGMSNMSHLDSVLMLAMEFDLQQVIKECYDYLDQWFVAHLTDLLFHCGELHSDKLSHGPVLREALLLDYAATLMSHQSLWQIGVDYFDYCPTNGRNHLELYLEKIELTSEHKAAKVLSLANERDMTGLARSICKVMCRRVLHENRLGSALSWAIKSKDAALASYLADRFLTEYALHGKFLSIDVLDNLGSCMLVSDRLTFLGKYRDFHKLYEGKEFEAAATLLVSLLTSQIAPKFFWLALLLDALPLLENEELVFNSTQTHDLLYCLQELTSYWKQPKVNIDENMLKEKEELIRLALTRNLAKAFIEEGSS